MKSQMIFVLILFSLCSNIYSEQHNQINSSNPSASLTVARDEILVKPADIKTINWDDIFIEYPFLSSQVSPKHFSDGFYKLALENYVLPDTILPLMLTDDRFDFVNPVYIYHDDKKMYMTSRTIIEYHPSNDDAIDNALLQYDLADKRNANYGDAWFKIIELKDGKDYNPTTLANAISTINLTEAAYPDFHLPFEPLMTPDDYFYSGQYSLDSLDMPLAWDLTINVDDSILIAILDDGFESHEDLSDSCWADGKDYIGSEFDPPPNDNEAPPEDCNYCYHGMAIVGIIKALTNNSIGVASIADQNSVRILGQQMINTYSPYSSSDFASAADIALAISDAADSGAAIINICWGLWPYNETSNFCRTIETALGSAYLNDSVFIVAGSGNWCDDSAAACDELCFPASLDYCFSVGGLGIGDTIASFSQGGPDLDVLAYGDRIRTTDRMGNKGISYSGLKNAIDDCDNTKDYTCHFDGTSAAAPMVTATAALIMQRRPDLIGDVETIADIIRYSCENPYSATEDTARISDVLGWGRINTMRALLAVSRGDANNDGSVNVSDAVYINNYVFKSGSAPQPHLLMGDANCDGYCNAGDAIFIINLVFKQGPAPAICYEYDNYN
ncbi:MAG: S8 family serine peptidase [Candidatus Zixiibacteriota bacterium]